MKARRLLKRLAFGLLPGDPQVFRYYRTWVYFPRGSLVFRLACAQGIYERDVATTIIRLVDEGTTYLDVGANIGLMSLPPLLHCRSLHAIAFEPSPSTLGCLERTRDGSRFRDRWEIVGKAVAARAGRAMLHLAAPRLGAFDSLADTRRVDFSARAGVEVTTLDCEWEARGRPRVSVIKIDTEGAELGVLRGARECLQMHRPFVVAECEMSNLAAHGETAATVLKLANDLDYRIHSIPGLVPIETEATLRLFGRVTESLLWAPKSA